MFQGFSGESIDFLWKIRFNNEISWFKANKDEYRAVLEKPMRELAQEVYDSFTEKHAELGLRLHISRIYRDARRLFGRGPLKDHLWFTLRRDDDVADRPAFWFELSPETWSYGLGYYQAEPSTMSKLRARIDNNPGPMEKLAEKLGRQSEFALEGEDYKRPKREPGKPLSEWYNKKTFWLVHEEKVGEALFSPDLAERLYRGFAFLAPFYLYFSTLSGDPDMGDR